MGGRVRAIVWLSLALQIAIVGTGGAVRLTGSGLGCPTWPRCTPESFVVMPEQGIHGAIEFGNRLITFVLAGVALATILVLFRQRRERRDLFLLAIAVGAGIPAQAVLGGITVLTGLNPWLVGAHFILSAMLVALATVLVFRACADSPHAAVSRTPRWYVLTSCLTALCVGITIVMGVITTGAGPHAGDAATPRNGLDPELLAHLHSYPAYIAFALTAVLVMAAATLRLDRVNPFVRGLLAAEVVQVAVGIAQTRLGLPGLLVGTHMVLACVLVTAMTAVVLSLRIETGESS
ncbi:MAG: COX15/CtaA family protein [Vicinamibacterales bacterium]